MAMSWGCGPRQDEVEYSLDGNLEECRSTDQKTAECGETVQGKRLTEGMDGLSYEG
jgi:hypothetical protein